MPASLRQRRSALYMPGSNPRALEKARELACDVVVTVDSLVAHLAAGGGADTRVLLDAGADSRWGCGRSRTAWYPTARLYWQDLKCGWSRAVTGLREAVDGG